MEPRNYLANANDTPPSAPASPSNGYPQSSVPGTSEATTPGTFWFYKVGEEMRNVLVAAGLTPTDAELDQLLGAVQSIAQSAIDSRTLTDESTATDYKISVIDGAMYLEEV